MSKKLTDPVSGEEIEALTPEELENEIAASVTAKEKELNDKFQAEIVKYQGDLKKFQDKDLNFSNLREAKEKIEKEYTDFKAGIEKEKAERDSKDIAGYRSQLFDAFANKDEEIKKKIEFHFNQLKESDTTDKVKIDELVKAAYKLATGEERTVLSGNVVSSAGGAPVKVEGVPANLIPHAKSMGLSEKDVAEYYSKAKELRGK